MRLGIYGGSFDPPHNYHAHIINSSLSLLKLDTLLVMPVWKQPLKSVLPAVSGETRVRMLRSFIDDSRIEISNTELRRKGVSYTVDTLRELEGKGSLYLIIGSDSASGFQKWKDYEEIFDRAEIAVFPRKGFCITDLPDKWSAKFHLLTEKTQDISSSSIRAMIGKGIDCSRLIPEGVWSIITEEGLYGWQKD